MRIGQLVRDIEVAPGCEVLPPSGMPQIRPTNVLPEDLVEFYTDCGGCSLFTEALYDFRIVKPTDFVPANPVIVGEACEDDISSDWYIIASDNSGNFLTIDLNLLRLGRCYMSYFDTHGIVGETKIIAMSFMELLQGLAESRGEYLFWMRDGFHELGDAYDGIG